MIYLKITQEPDPYLDETVNIALDLAKLEKPTRGTTLPRHISIRHRNGLIFNSGKMPQIRCYKM